MIPGSHCSHCSHGRHGSAGEEACYHRGGQVGEVVQGLQEAQPYVLCSSSVQYRTACVYMCMCICVRVCKCMQCMYMYVCECISTDVCICIYVCV